MMYFVKQFKEQVNNTLYLTNYKGNVELFFKYLKSIMKKMKYREK